MSEHTSRLTFRNSTIVQRFDLTAKADDTVDEEFEIDANAYRVYGILLTSDREDLLFYRGSQQIELNGHEVTPEGYESKLLMSGLNVSPTDRFHPMDRPVGNRKIDIKFKDTDHPKAPFEEYRVTMYVYSKEDSDGGD